MPISVVGKTNLVMPSTRTDNGFSLIELLVVLVIISLSVAMASLAIPSSKSQDNQPVKDLFGWASACVDEARFTGDVVGLRFDEDDDLKVSAHRLNLRLESWSPSTCAGLASEQLDLNGGNITLLDVDGRKLDIQSNDSFSTVPHIVFLPSGEITSFELVVDGSGIVRSDGVTSLSYEVYDAR